MSEHTFRKGDKVAWNTSQGETTGVVVARRTEPFSIKGTDLHASEDDPRYVVRSDRTGEEAGHKADALTKRS
jgi:hypothetical protein